MHTWTHNTLNLIWVLISLGVVYKIIRAQSQEHLVAKLGGTLVILGIALFVLNLFNVAMYPGNNFGLLRLLTWTVFLHIPLFFAGVAIILWKKRRIVAVLCGLATLSLVLIAIDAFFIEPQWLQTSTVTLDTPKLDAPLRVAVIADIQTDRPGDYERTVMRKVMEAQPDLILFTGDYIHLGKRSRDYATESAELNTLFKSVNLDAPLGVYAIQGNVDGSGSWAQIFAGLPVTTSDATTHVDLGPIALTALSMHESFDGATTIPQNENFHIVMGHSPNFSLGTVEADLLIAGHTHGGQVQIPLLGPILTLSRVPRGWASGVTEIAPGKTLIVSRGIGLERGEAPRLRFFCRPELVIIDLVPTAPQ